MGTNSDSVDSESVETTGESSTDDADQATTCEEPSSFLWLTNRDQWLVVIVSVAVVISVGSKWRELRYVDRSEIVLERATDDIGYQIELNSATWVELTQLRGIGETYARRIVDNREVSGPFASVDDLQRVRGIGPKTVEKNRRWLRVELPASADD